MKREELEPGMRVRIDPTCDVYTMGYKYATVVSIGPKWVRLDAERDGRQRRIHLPPEKIREISDQGSYET